MKNEQHRELVKQVLRTEKARRNVSYAEISERLKEYGVIQSATNLSSKASRGLMDAGLFLAILDTLGVVKLDIPDLFADLPPRSTKKAASPSEPS